MKQIEKFSDLPFDAAILRAVQETGYETPTPIQKQALPLLLEGHDLLGCAQTGTGKTAAFALPMLQHLMTLKQRPQPKKVRSLILTPTRELAIQIFESFQTYGKYTNLKFAVVFGGVSHSAQTRALQGGLDVLIATPGRLMDHMEQRHVSLSDVEIFVLDEADRMLDMGFIRDIKRILPHLPLKRQNLFFSATMPKDITTLAEDILRNPKRVEVVPESTPAERIQQSILFVDRSKKRDLLRHLLQDKSLDKVIVFTRTKHGANRVTELLDKNGIRAAAIHGNKSQNARQKALEEFKRGQVRVLIATDIAARGIDIDDVSHVINYELPNIAESYVHRIGRTARAGASGIAISFCEAEEKAYLKDIEKIIGQPIQVITDHPFHSEEVANSRAQSKGKAKASIERTEQGGGRRGRPSSGRRQPASGAGGRSAGGASARTSAPRAASNGSERPASSQRSSTDRVSADRPAPSRVANDRTSNDGGSNGRSNNDRPAAARSSNDRFSNDRPRNDRSSNDRPSGTRSNGSSQIPAAPRSFYSEDSGAPSFKRENDSKPGSRPRRDGGNR